MSAIFSLILLIPAALPVPALDDLDDMVQEFQRFYKGNASVAEKIEAIHVLDRADSPRAVEALVECFDDADYSVRQTAVDVIGAYRSPECAQWLIDNIVANKRVRDEDQRVVAIQILGHMGQEIAVQPIRDLLDKRAKEPLLHAAASALGMLKAKDAAPDLVPFLENSDASVRIAMLDALGEIKEPTTNAAVLTLLEDSTWQVQASAIMALSRIRQKESIQPLIDLLAVQKGRLRDDISQALLALTTFDLGDNAEKWQTTWDRVKDRFEVPTEAEIKKAREAFEASQIRYQPGSDDFAGIPTKSTRQLYVIDISGSMEDPLLDRDKFRLQGRTYRSFVKMEVVRQELIRTVENLDDTVFFNVVAFATEVKLWKKGLVQANILNRKSAVQFIERLQPIGGASQNLKRKGGLSASAGGGLGKTNTHAALLAALDAKATQAGYDTNMGSPVDTIFFLSDGDPTAGEITEVDRLLAEVKRLNAVRKVAIHTINIGTNQRGKLLLQALAQQNGGTYLDLGG